MAVPLKAGNFRTEGSPISQVTPAPVTGITTRADNPVVKNNFTSGPQSERMEHDVVVVGGGCVGISTAYHLAERGRYLG